MCRSITDKVIVEKPTSPPPGAPGAAAASTAANAKSEAEPAVKTEPETAAAATAEPGAPADVKSEIDASKEPAPDSAQAPTDDASGPVKTESEAPPPVSAPLIAQFLAVEGQTTHTHADAPMEAGEDDGVGAEPNAVAGASDSSGAATPNAAPAAGDVPDTPMEPAGDNGVGVGAGSPAGVEAGPAGSGHGDMEGVVETGVPAGDGVDDEGFVSVDVGEQPMGEDTTDAGAGNLAPES